MSFLNLQNGHTTYTKKTAYFFASKQFLLYYVDYDDYNSYTDLSYNTRSYDIYTTSIQYLIELHQSKGK